MTRVEGDTVAGMVSAILSDDMHDIGGSGSPNIQCGDPFHIGNLV